MPVKIPVLKLCDSLTKIPVFKPYNSSKKIPVFKDHWTTGEPQRADTNTYSGYVHHGNISPPPSGMANTAKKFGCRESNNNSPPGNAVPNQNPQQSAERKLPTVTQNSQNSYTIGNYVPLGASYYASNDTIGYFFDNEIGEKVQFTDFKLTFVEKQRHISFDANFSDHYRILLTDALEEKHDLLVYHESLGDLYSTIEHKCPECQFFSDVVAGCREKFKRLVGILLKLQRPPLILLYKRWGWGNLENGIRIFYHGGRRDCVCEKVIPVSEQDQYTINKLQDALNIFNIGTLEVTAPMVLYSLASYMDAPFTDAGHPLAHCLMLVGESGFLKTSAAKVIFSPFSRVEERVFSVRSTEASLNVLHERYFDDTLVVDDFNLEGSSYEVKRKTTTIQNLIRAYSDKTPKAKYSGNDDIRQYAIRGGCVFTGETTMEGELKSGELRYVKVIFHERLNEETLLTFQNDQTLMQHLCGCFIHFVEQQYAQIVDYIKHQFVKLREESSISEPRMLDTYIHFKVVLDVLVKCLYFYGYERDVGWAEQVQQVIFGLVSKQSTAAQVHEPYIRYLEEVWHLIGTGDIKLAENVDSYAEDVSKYHGYLDGADVIMLKKDQTYTVVTTAFRARGDYLPIGVNEVSQKLRDNELSRCTDGCLTRASSKVKGRPRMLALIVKKCEEKLNESKSDNNFQ